MKIFALIGAAWMSLWFTPDQQGARLYERQEYGAAAAVFEDPLWQGTAWYRAGEFEKAARFFSRRESAEGYYNQGNARLMLGKYEAAIDNYDKALEIRPEWKEAFENRELARARAELVEQKGGEMGDQKIGADEIVFDKNAENNKGQETEVSPENLSGEDVQALWLRRVQTRPADFLKAKFAYQQSAASGDGAP